MNKFPHIRKRPLSRRAVLRGLGGAAIALPLLDAMRGSASACTTGCPKRLLIMYTPNGNVAADFWPAAGSTEFDFNLGPILEPLMAHKQDMLILDGINMTSAKYGPGDAHQKGTGQCLTATELLDGDFQGDAGQSAGWAGGISVDQQVADVIGTETLYRSLELGVAVQGSDVGARICYRGPSQPLPPENSPYAAYQRLFGDATGDPLQVERRATKRRAVLDAVADDHRKLRDQLGGDDRQKLENHLVAVEELRERVDRAVIEFDQTCMPLQQGTPIDHELVLNMPPIGQLQMDLLAMAMACDLTRVGTLMWTRSAATHVCSFAGVDIEDGHHTIAHKADADTAKLAQNTLINRWYAEQLAYLVAKLKATPEGDGTAFDNTLILWTNEQAKGNNHSVDRMPYLLIGNAGGYFQTGRYIQQASEVSHNQLLVSVLNAMGIETEEFGNVEYGTGPLPGLL
jgi:hypothetical protein